MKYSVIINNHNYGRFIGYAIESVLRQTHADFELIVVDDGSTDGSRAAISSYDDPRIRKIFQPNAGQGCALRAGIDAAIGEVIALLDSDDEWVDTKLETCATVLRKDKNISLLTHGMEVIDVGGNKVGARRLAKQGYYDPQFDYRRLSFDLPFGPTSTVVGYRKYFQQLRFEPSIWRLAADTPIIAGLSVLGHCYVLPDSLTRYRVHADNGFEGRQSYRNLLDLRRRFYESVAAQVQPDHRFGSLDFSRSSVYLAQKVISKQRGTLAGLSIRLKYYWAKALGC